LQYRESHQFVPICKPTCGNKACVHWIDLKEADYDKFLRSGTERPLKKMKQNLSVNEIGCTLSEKDCQFRLFRLPLPENAIIVVGRSQFNRKRRRVRPYWVVHRDAVDDDYCTPGFPRSRYRYGTFEGAFGETEFLLWIEYAMTEVSRFKVNCAGLNYNCEDGPVTFSKNEYIYVGSDRLLETQKGDPWIARDDGELVRLENEEPVPFKHDDIETWRERNLIIEDDVQIIFNKRRRLTEKLAKAEENGGIPTLSC